MITEEDYIRVHKQKQELYVRIETLEAALQPFARLAENTSAGCHAIAHANDLRRARAALERNKDGN